jgi:predicted O-linked N-acetylglucosamine transferase (SPINDLY family)
VGESAALEAARERLKARDLEGAANLLLDALRRDPTLAPAHLMLAALRAEQGDFDLALDHLDRSFAAQPLQAPAAHLLHVRAALDARKPERAQGALESFRRSVAAHPAYPHGRVEEARAWWLLARQLPLGRSVEALRRAVDLDEGNADAWNDLGNALANLALHAEAREAYTRALQAAPDYHQVESNLLVALHYDPGLDARALHEAHLRWSRRHTAGIARIALGPRVQHMGLRVGFLSPAFAPGPTSAFLAPLVANLDRARFGLFAYNVGPAEGLDAAIVSAIPHWRHAAGDDDEALAQRIAADALDVLVDLAGHTPGGRPRALARKPARAIVEWLDYWDTTGLEAVDVLVGDTVSAPPDSPQRFTERVERIDPCRFCFAAPAHAPAVAVTPALANGFVTFGSFNRLSKTPRPVLALWARVLAAVPGSRLLLKNTALADPATRERVARGLREHGIERFELRGPSPHAAMLAEYGDIDVALDPFPFNGGLTTCEALWMGVPVLAQLGDSMISRQSASMLEAAGESDWIAASAAGLVAIAAAQCASHDELGRRRALRRDALARSALMDGARFAAAFAAILERAGVDAE